MPFDFLTFMFGVCVGLAVALVISLLSLRGGNDE